MTEIYVDITQYINNRLNTGIQRVVKEYLYRETKQNPLLVVLFYDTTKKDFVKISKEELLAFLENVSFYKFKNMVAIDIFQKSKNKKIFFDIDSVWNSALKREGFYKKLKQNSFYIYNFIYDLIPILFPHFMYKTTTDNFRPYIEAIFQYSDFVFFDSYSARDDFTNIQKKSPFFKPIKKEVIYLGSDFCTQKKDTKLLLPPRYTTLLSKKYILFVGTLEPRKNQNLLIDVFDELYKKNQDLHLVFIGKIGWNVETLLKKIDTHPQKDKNIHHLIDVDDESLYLFYQNAYIVTYLSHYEGYGLPIIESLQHGNITLVSKNSSMPEVGKKFVDYIENNSKKQLLFLLSNYLKNPKLYDTKKQYIKKYFKTSTWCSFHHKINDYLI